MMPHRGSTPSGSRMDTAPSQLAGRTAGADVDGAGAGRGAVLELPPRGLGLFAVRPPFPPGAARPAGAAATAARSDAVRDGRGEDAGAGVAFAAVAVTVTVGCGAG
ncbi:hypothetical protein NE236_42115 [Actinoallomurus purpureus]|uniref:hypothetical protein n=1 Tax=Actinoallomurus purpureus TaxID=478114 RepID=UPI0020928D13|nr:hypothetical protein [Actinoallomurus purpureus]MCO6011567.1 hypothetical protein [Actinoallomurus purpureus]